ncbi:MAG: hypothetical protein KJ000_02680 [Pirellulaceae bacterium]|nr:hypothetical protein [Pirellulaceae bacterium]
MKSAQSLVASLMVCLPAATLLADDLATWKTYPVASHGNLTVNLRIRPEATLADEEWIAIEFVNQGASPIKVKEASYSMERTDRDFRGGPPGRQPSLASGNSQSLFPDAWERSPVRPMVIPPGTYRVIEQPSSSSSALLGLAPQRGQRIQATIQLELVLDDGTKVTTKPQATRFEFEWLRPDTDGFHRMRVRLERLVANPKFCDFHADIVGQLLRIDSVSSELTLPQLLAGLEKYGGMITGRERLAMFIDHRFPNDPALVTSLEQRLRRSDRAVLHDMTHMPNTWDDRLLEPLLAMFEADDANWRLVLNVLDLHGSPQKSDAAIARRLSRAIVASGALNDDSVNAVVKISHALQTLGRTHDRAAAKHVKRLLDDKRPVGVESVSPIFLTRLPAFRVCDEALEAVLMLLDSDASAMYPEFENDGKTFEAIYEKIAEERDELIAKVKKRISEN